MRRITTILGIIALSACATTTPPSVPAVQASTQKSAAEPVEASTAAPIVKTASTDCEALYSSYQATMAAFKPAKKSFLEKGLSMGGAATSIFAPKLIGSGVDPNDLLNVQKGISVAENINGNGNFENMVNATSALGATQAAMTQADQLGCDKAHMAKLAAEGH